MNEQQRAETFTQIVLEIFRLGGLLVAEGDRMSAPFGLTSARWKILGAIAVAGQAQTVPQIARAMGLTRQAVQRLVDAMHGDGLLQWHDNPEHKRARLLSLTPAAEQAYAQLYQTQSAWALDASAEIAPDALQQTLATLRRISTQFGA